MRYSILALLIFGSAAADDEMSDFDTRPNGVFGGTDYSRPNSVVPEVTTRPNVHGSVNVYKNNSVVPIKTCFPSATGGVTCR